MAFIGMVVTTALVTASDPTDPAPAFEALLIANKSLDDGSGMKFINTSCQYFCNVCLSHVFEGSKHCSFCNRCVFGFDHHCRWVSNDIGSLNYVMFIRMLLFTLATLLIQITFHSTLIDQLPSLDDVTESSAFLSIDESIALCYAMLVFCVVLFLPLMLLLGFHIYLIS